MKQKTAILFFSESATVVANRKALHGNVKNNNIIIEAGIKNAIQQIKKTGITYFLSDEHKQQGSTFGQKISSAMQEIYDKGFDNVIVLGNDAPMLTSRHILQAAHHLQHHSVVIMPTQISGAAIVAMQAKVFDKENIQSLPWGSDQLFEALRSYASAAYCLKATFEINNRGQLMKLAKILPDASLIKKIFVSTSAIKRTNCKTSSSFSKLRASIASLHNLPPPIIA